MASIINTNIAATRTHNIYNRNSDYMNTAMTRVATGMKINSAKDGASTWAISEKMRERIRANDQANQNIQNAQDCAGWHRQYNRYSHDPQRARYQRVERLQHQL